MLPFRLAYTSRKVRVMRPSVDAESHWLSIAHELSSAAVTSAAAALREVLLTIYANAGVAAPLSKCSGGARKQKAGVLDVSYRSRRRGMLGT